MEREHGAPRRWRSPPETWDKLRSSAKSFRAGQTAAEKKLWAALRNSQVAGARFRRQHAIDRFLVDFYCSEAHLVIEVDGPVHDAQIEEDSVRKEHIERLGFRVLRFKNEDVLNNLDTVLARIAEAVS
jgi:very-short-patch-repair endonuclease